MIPDSATTLKYVTVLICNIYMPLLILLALHPVLKPKPRCQKLAWIFWLLLFSEAFVTLAALLFRISPQPLFDGLQNFLSGIYPLLMIALVLLLFDGHPLRNYLFYTVLNIAQTVLMAIAYLILSALGFEHDFFSVSVVTELPRFFVCNLLFAAATWFSFRLLLRILDKLTKIPVFLYGASVILYILDSVPILLFPENGQIVSLSPSRTQGIVLTLIAFALVALAIIIVFIWQIRQNALRQEYDNLQIILHMQYDHVRQLEQNQALLQKQHHDFRHHLLVLKTLLDDSKAAEAQAYIEKLQPSSEVPSALVSCGNPVIDAAINSNLASAQRDAIAVKCAIALPEHLHPSDIDLVCAFSNLLSNAIEACDRLPDGASKVIELSARVSAGMLLIVVRNSAQPEASDFRSQKKGDHGWGLKILNDIAVRNNGHFEITQDADRVTAVLSLSNS